MLRRPSLAGLAVALVQLTAATVANSAPPAPPSPQAILVVVFPGSRGDAEFSQLQETFRVDLGRIASRLPVKDIAISWPSQSLKVEQRAFVRFAVRGREPALDVVAQRFVRAIKTLPYVGFVSVQGNSGEPDAWTGEGEPLDGRTRDVGGPAARDGLAGRLRFDYAGPNPSPAHFRFVYSIPEPGGDVRVRVYDVKGRLTAELFSGTRAPGVWTTKWDAVDARGHAVPAGVYIVKVQMAGQSLVRRVVLTR